MHTRQIDVIADSTIYPNDMELDFYSVKGIVLNPNGTVKEIIYKVRGQKAIRIDLEK